MQLGALLSAVPNISTIPGIPPVEIQGIVSDSRQVTPGALFVAYRGVATDGHAFIADAVTRGAAAVIGEKPLAGLPVPYVQVPDGRAALAWFNAAWHGYPGRSMALVGVTGTDGKTTTSNLIYSILRAAGKRAGLISTVNAVIGEQAYDTGLHTTTPDAHDVQHFLSRMRDARTEVAVLEATSHGLAQHRLTGCDFDVAVVTNITHEHLDFHGSYEAYRDAKAALFRFLAGSVPKPGLPKTAVLNRDDDSFSLLAPIEVERRIIYGKGEPRVPAAPLEGSVTELSAVEVSQTSSGLAVKVHVAESGVLMGRLVLRSPLIGNYNVYNLLAAAGAALALDIGPDAIQQGVAALQSVSGRMERIDRGQPFAAIVDFAHTPPALENALETARWLAGGAGRVIVVFGSAGLRDRDKRRLMGVAAARLADFTIITAEDPRTEDVAAIMAETASAMIAAGRVEGEGFARVEDRQQAILYGARLARPGDVLIICGKGHEESMCFGATEYPWRDQDALSWALDQVRNGPEAGGAPPFLLPTWYENLT